MIFGLDDTTERRWGAKVAARGIYRDPVWSSRSHFVKVSGLRWLCMMLLVPIPLAARVWALPFFTALCPSERYHERLGKRHKTLTDWARQMIRQIWRWLPGRPSATLLTFWILVQIVIRLVGVRNVWPSSLVIR